MPFSERRDARLVYRDAVYVLPMAFGRIVPGAALAPKMGLDSPMHACIEKYRPQILYDDDGDDVKNEMMMVRVMVVMMMVMVMMATMM